MFSLQPSDELVFGTPTTCVGSHEILQDPTMYDGHAFIRSESNFINFSTDKRVDSGSTRQSHEREESNSKKVVHRDTERKRRKEMSQLYLTLASLLPPIQQIKGKRAVCDQMQEAADYIKSMENKIEELKIQRDKLIKSSENKVEISSSGSDGIMEILIKTHEDDYYGISNVLEALAQMEVDVVNCLSTRICNPGDGFLHKIQIQGRDMKKSLDVSVLQHKLSNAIK